MSGTQFYSATGASRLDQTRNLTENVRSLASLARTFFESIGDIQSAMVRDTVGALLPEGANIKLRRGVCSFPDASCADTRVGKLRRTAYVGEVVRMPVRFRNATSKTRRFVVAAKDPLRDSKGDDAATLRVAPEEFTLAPGEARLVDIAAPVDNKFAAGFEYATRVRIESDNCEDQFLSVCIYVAADDAGPTVDLKCPCKPPVRPLRWYHHYYCDPPQDRTAETKPPRKPVASKPRAKK